MLALIIVLSLDLPAWSRAVHPEACEHADIDDSIPEEASTILLQVSMRETRNQVETSGTNMSDYLSSRANFYSITRELSPTNAVIFAQTATFISNNGLLCVEGLIRDTMGALALKQAGLHGAMYNDSLVLSSTECSSQGYTFQGGEDPAYVGVSIFFRSAVEQVEFQNAESQALQAYRAQYGLSEEMASLMSRCTAHLQSEVGLAVAGQCDPVNQIRGSWMHHDLVDRSFEHICDDGPFQHATFAMAVLKTTRQFPQHPYDQIKVGDCYEWGFNYPPPAKNGPDHCFARFESDEARLSKQEAIWEMHCNANPARMYDAVMADEHTLFRGGFDDQAQQLGLDPNVTYILSITRCHCLPTTEVFEKHAGDCTDPQLMPPIREWWWGQ